MPSLPSGKAYMADVETTKINLSNDVTVNGRVYKAGRGVEVPKAQAEDIERIDHEHNQYLAGLNKRHVYKANAGTIAMGQGAE